MNLRNIIFNNTFRQSFFFAVTKFVGVLLTFYSTIFISNNFGNNALGSYSFLSKVVMILTLVTVLGLDVIIEKYQSAKMYSAKNFNTTITFILISCSLLGAISFLFSNYISLYMQKPSYSLGFKYMGLLLLSFSLLRIYTAILKSSQSVYMYSVMSNFCSLMFFLLILFLFKNHVTEDSIIAFYGLSIFITLSISYLFTKFFIQDDSIIFRAFALDIDVLKKSFPFFLLVIIVLIPESVDILTLGFVEKNETIGTYEILLKIALIPRMTLLIVNAVISPKIAKSYLVKDFVNLEMYIKESSKFIFIGTLSLIVILLFLQPHLMSYFKIDNSVYASILIVLIAGKIFDSLTGPTQQIMMLTDCEKELLKISVLTLTLNIILNFIFYYKFGLIGIAIAGTFCSALNNIISVYIIKQKLNIYSIFFLK